ncbi:MAG: hypothetical protein CFE28_10700 [Alphaproteobacteria bacterium PA2]|nr:MAG: hypothetical protein CFE28_10700 [Alphaproteobacteria bacterium PA2]
MTHGLQLTGARHLSTTKYVPDLCAHRMNRPGSRPGDLHRRAAEQQIPSNLRQSLAETEEISKASFSDFGRRRLVNRQKVYAGAHDTQGTDQRICIAKGLNNHHKRLTKGLAEIQLSLRALTG